MIFYPRHYFLKIQRKKLFFWFLVLVMLGASFSFGWFIRGGSVSSTKRLATAVRLKTNYKFISPLLATGDSEVFRGFPGLVSNLSKFLAEQKSNGDISTASIYFRELQSSLWMEINENERYAPASMLKIALLISYLKATESRPDILEQQALYSGFPESRRAFNGPTVLIPGRKYSIAELLEDMIDKSDNDAKDMLQPFVSANDRTSVFSDLGLAIPSFNDTGDSFSPKEYSIFFRVLYNATYLSPELSEYALELLSKTEFQDGIVKGVPGDIVVAHKFGRRTIPASENPSASLELHDCGIVYYPGHPYFICIMTKGNTDSALQYIIQTISKTIYAEVDNRYK